MKTSFALRYLLAIVLAGGFGIAVAQEHPTRSPQSPAAHRSAAPARPAGPTGPGLLRLLPADAVSEHTVDTAEGKLAYTATAGTLAFFNQSGEKSADVFYTAYVKKDGGAERPLTFVFNGGPGAASAFLNLGLVGPRILDLGPQGHDGAQGKLIDNPDTWLRFTDLVLVDPIGTGWSRTANPDDAKHFWSPRSDAGAMAKAVALYVDKHDRAGSPKYLLGESYGGLRAAMTARALQREQGIMVNGIVMLSPLLEGWLTFGDDNSALRAALAAAVAGGGHARAQGRLQPRGAAPGGEIRHDRLSHHARRRGPARRGGQCVLREGGAGERPADRGGEESARLRHRRLYQDAARVRRQDRQPL